MSNLFDYSQTPASNNSTPPDGAPEGMAPSAVNNTMRQMMSAGAGAFNVYTAGGTANAQTVTMDPTLAAYSTKVRIAFIPVANNTGACTLNVNALGVKSIKMPDGTDPPADALDSDGVALVQYNGTNFILLAVANIVTTNNTSTLTNKTLTSPTINGAALSGTITGTPTFSQAIVLSQPDINGGTIDGATIGGDTPAAITGTTINANNTITANGGGANTLDLKPGSSDHFYMQFYARTATPSTRSGYFGYSSAASDDIDLVNEISGGDINLSATGGAVKIGGSNALVSGGALGTPSSGTLTNCTGLPVAGISDYESNSYTGTATDMTTSPTGTVYYSRIGNTVTLTIPTISGTSNADPFSITGAPASIRPTATTGYMSCIVTDNGVAQHGYVRVSIGGALLFFTDVGGSEFQNTGTKGVTISTISYNLNQS